MSGKKSALAMSFVVAFLGLAVPNSAATAKEIDYSKLKNCNVSSPPCYTTLRVKAPTAPAMAPAMAPASGARAAQPATPAPTPTPSDGIAYGCYSNGTVTPAGANGACPKDTLLVKIIY